MMEAEGDAVPDLMGRNSRPLIRHRLLGRCFSSCRAIIGRCAQDVVRKGILLFVHGCGS